MPTKSRISAKREVYLSKIWKPFYMYFIYIYSIHVVVCLLISWLNVAKNATKDKWNTFTICNYTAPKTLISFQHAKYCLKKVFLLFSDHVECEWPERDIWHCLLCGTEMQSRLWPGFNRCGYISPTYLIARRRIVKPMPTASGSIQRRFSLSS